MFSIRLINKTYVAKEVPMLSLENCKKKCLQIPAEVNSIYLDDKICKCWLCLRNDTWSHVIKLCCWWFNRYVVLNTGLLKLSEFLQKRINDCFTCLAIWIEFLIHIPCYSCIGCKLFLFCLFNWVKLYKHELCMFNEEQLKRLGTKHFCRTNMHFRCVSAETVA